MIAPPTPANLPPTCLLVDDSRVVRKVARRILERNGFAVAEAEDGAQALQHCRRELPRCVLLDWNMPVMNGLAFLRALRAEFGPDGPKVVFCTTENAVAHMAAAMQSGAQGYITKPFDELLLTGKFAQIGLM